MVRLALLSVLTVLVLAVAPASAQQTGGESLAPEVLNTPGAAETIRDRVFARLQMLQVMQQIRAAGPSSAAAGAGNPNAVNSSLDRSSFNQQMLALIPPKGGRIRPQVAESQPTFIDQSQVLVLNTAGGPVNVGNDNIVQQQVSTSTAISNGGGTARSTAAASNDTASHGGGHGKAARGTAATSQSANSTAVSVGGPAVATAANSNIVSRGTPH